MAKIYNRDCWTGGHVFLRILIAGFRFPADIQVMFS